MKLSRDRLRQIINEEVAMAREFPPVSESATGGKPMSPQQLLQTVDELGKLVSWAIKHSDDPEVVERMERADQMVTQLYSSVTNMLPGPGHDDEGYSKMAGTRPMEEYIRSHEEKAAAKEEFASTQQEAQRYRTGYKSSHEEKADIKADAAFADDTLDNLERLMDRTGQVFSDDEEKILAQAFELLDRMRA